MAFFDKMANPDGGIAEIGIGIAGNRE